MPIGEKKGKKTGLVSISCLRDPQWSAADQCGSHSSHIEVRVLSEDIARPEADFLLKVSIHEELNNQWSQTKKSKKSLYVHFI